MAEASDRTALSRREFVKTAAATVALASFAGAEGRSCGGE